MHTWCFPTDNFCHHHLSVYSSLLLHCCFSAQPQRFLSPMGWQISKWKGEAESYFPAPNWIFPTPVFASTASVCQLISPRFVFAWITKFFRYFQVTMTDFLGKPWSGNQIILIYPTSPISWSRTDAWHCVRRLRWDLLPLPTLHLPLDIEQGFSHTAASQDVQLWAGPKRGFCLVEFRAPDCKRGALALITALLLDGLWLQKSHFTSAPLSILSGLSQWRWDLYSMLMSPRCAQRIFSNPDTVWDMQALF